MACKRSAVRSRLAPPDFAQDRIDFRPASPSSRGLGHHPFTVRTGVRIPVGTPLRVLGAPWRSFPSSDEECCPRLEPSYRRTATPSSFIASMWMTMESRAWEWKISALCWDYALPRSTRLLGSASLGRFAATFGVSVKAQVEIVEAITDAVSDIAPRVRAAMTRHAAFEYRQANASRMERGRNGIARQAPV